MGFFCVCICVPQEKKALERKAAALEDELKVMMHIHSNVKRLCAKINLLVNW